MSNDYCVYLTIYKGNKMPIFYIGSTSIKRILKGYKGSVKSKEYKEIWNNELKFFPELFKIKILSLHKTRKEALDNEEKYHLFLRVDKHPLHINKSTAHGTFGLKTTGNPGIRSEKTKLKISKSRKGKGLGKRNTEICIAISNGLKGHKVSDQTRKKLSDINKGKKLSEETKKKISIKMKEIKLFNKFK